MNTNSTPPKSNAFSVLMGSQKKKKKESTSRFVSCPGCSKLVLSSAINVHLDECVVEGVPLRKKQRHGLEKVEQTASASPVTTIHETDETVTNPPEKNSDPSNNHCNAFTHMMERSTKVFSSSADAKLAQRFHLNSDGSLRVFCYSTSPGLSQPDHVHWSASVLLKPRKGNQGGIDQTTNENPNSQSMPVDLILSSEIASAPPRKMRLVHRHSRLSIPVLKSILQKAIRRRRPLPAVRIAMELADKSLGDLLRRLPIIMLEDSTLHPSFPLLTWLMAAHSKDFQLNDFLLAKVLVAVYEIASCPWQDCIMTTDAVVSNVDLSFGKYHKPGLDYLLEDRETVIWSMLMRANYGGMNCDLEMLFSAARMWNMRLEDDDNIPHSIQERIGAVRLEKTLSWSTLSTIVHQTSSRQSQKSVTPMVENGLAALTFTDVSTEGIDFHCTSVLDVILSDHQLFNRCAMEFGAVSTIIGLGPVPEESTEKRAWLERVLKRCMWKYSAGVNRRLSLIGQESITDVKKEDRLEQVWLSLASPKTTAFAESYLRQRLVS
jgi:hypothetical protein